MTSDTENAIDMTNASFRLPIRLKRYG
jgi:hypothetical protein